MTLFSTKTDSASFADLRRLGLRALLRWGFGLLIVGVVLTVSLGFLVWYFAYESFNEFEHEDAPVAALASRNVSAWSRTRGYEKDFLLSARGSIGVAEAHMRYVKPWKTTLDDIRANLAETRRIEQAADILKPLADIENSLGKYEAGFNMVVNTVLRLGFIDTGLEGALRDNVHEAERIVLIYKHEPLTRSLLLLRRHEKDFMLRGKQIYFTEFKKELNRFERVAAAGPVSAEKREYLLAAIKQYADYFEQYVATTQQLVEQTQEYLEVARRIEPALDNLQQVATRHAAAGLEAVERRIVGATLIAAVVGVLMILLAVSVSEFVSRRIVSSTQSIIGFAEDVAAGRLGMRLKIEDQGEFGALESALNRMTDRLQENVEAMQAHATALSESNRRIALLGEMTGLLQTADNLHEASRIIARHMVQAGAGKGGAVYLYKESRDYLDVLARWGDVALPDNFTPEDCWALRRGQPYGSIEEEPALKCAHVAGSTDERLYLCLPMVAQGVALGLVHVVFGTERSAGLKDEALYAHRISDQLSLALGNLKLRETLREQSLRDPLTNLYNRRYLDVSIEREFAQGAREKAPVAVLMLDVDHFKRFNDSHGHDAGDAALRQVGRVLKQHCRASDLACRFGGEEFTVVLPGADREIALGWAKRLLELIRALEISMHGNILPHLSISIGIALYPEHGEDAETVLQAADLALYDAKHTGRDRCVFSGEVIEKRPAQELNQ